MRTPARGRRFFRKTGFLKPSILREPLRSEPQKFRTDGLCPFLAAIKAFYLHAVTSFIPYIFLSLNVIHGSPLTVLGSPSIKQTPHLRLLRGVLLYTLGKWRAMALSVWLCNYFGMLW
jgi:hypothetical protein